MASAPAASKPRGLKAGSHGGSIFANRKSKAFNHWPHGFVEWATDLGVTPASKG